MSCGGGEEKRGPGPRVAAESCGRGGASTSPLSGRTTAKVGPLSCYFMLFGHHDHYSTRHSPASSQPASNQLVLSCINTCTYYATLARVHAAV